MQENFEPQYKEQSIQKFSENGNSQEQICHLFNKIKHYPNLDTDLQALLQVKDNITHIKIDDGKVIELIFAGESLLYNFQGADLKKFKAPNLEKGLNLKNLNLNCEIWLEAKENLTCMDFTQDISYTKISDTDFFNSIYRQKTRDYQITEKNKYNFEYKQGEIVPSTERMQNIIYILKRNIIKNDNLSQIIFNFNDNKIMKLKHCIELLQNNNQYHNYIEIDDEGNCTNIHFEDNITNFEQYIDLSKLKEIYAKKMQTLPTNIDLKNIEKLYIPNLELPIFLNQLHPHCQFWFNNKWGRLDQNKQPIDINNLHNYYYQKGKIINVQKDKEREQEIKDLFNIEQENISQNIEELMDNSEIHSNINTIDIEKLKKLNLHPKYKLKINDANIYFSDLFEMWQDPYNTTNNMRNGIVVYIQIGNNKPVIRTFYQSTSHGLWKAIAGYTEKSNGDIDWFGKGTNEQSLSLPFILQKTINNIPYTTNYANNRVLHKQDYNAIIKGLNNMLNTSWYNKTTQNDYDIQEKTMIEYYQEKIPSKILKGNFYDNTNDDTTVPKPEDMYFENIEQKPNFNNIIDSYKFDSKLYGKIYAELIASHDKKINYLFFSNTKGQIWISHIEYADINITHTGLNNKWIDGGFLTIPIYERMIS